MSDSNGRLVITRTTKDKGNKVAIRLSPDVDRATDLTSVLSAGLSVEVVDVEIRDEGVSPLVTLRFDAPREFRVDRVERVEAPRKPSEIGSEAAVRSKVLKHEAMNSMEVEALDDYRATLLETETFLKSQLRRLKRDKSIASDRGYRHTNNDNFFRWVMIEEEIDVITEQLEMVRITLQSAANVRKKKLRALNEKKRGLFTDCFVQLAKESMAESTFERLRAKAEAMADQRASSANATA